MSQTENTKNGLQRCDQHLILQLSKLRPKSVLGSRKSVQNSHCVTVTLMKRHCLCQKLSCFLFLLSISVSSFSSDQNKVGAAPGGNISATTVTNVSLPALARPSPSSDPEKGNPVGPVQWLWFVISRQAMKKPPKSSPLVSCITY